MNPCRYRVTGFPHNWRSSCGTGSPTHSESDANYSSAQRFSTIQLSKAAAHARCFKVTQALITHVTRFPEETTVVVPAFERQLAVLPDRQPVVTSDRRMFILPGWGSA
jgi:hypothetical protein